MSDGFQLGAGDPLDWIKSRDEVVIGQLGQSLDGRIATHTGHSKYINDESGLAHLHALRASVDAVLVGVGTVNADDPLLTVRLCGGQSPVRVVIDPNGRIFAESRLFSDDGPPIVVITAPETELPHIKAGAESNGKVDVLRIARSGGRMCPREIRKGLAERNLKRLLIEGGSRTLSAFMNADCLDRLHIITAPLLLGSGYPGLQLSAVGKVDEAKKPKVTLYNLGHDLLFDCDLS
ncbi:MAG: RibD family protein [Pseudomonadota bacterium]